MLKELWKKLGADFMQADDGMPAEGQLGPSEARVGAEGVRVIPHITHTGEFHLGRLTQLLRERYGRALAIPEHTSISDHTLKDVISFASRIQDQDIQRELLLFYLNCSPVIQEVLRSETLLGQDRRVPR